MWLIGNRVAADRVTAASRAVFSPLPPDARARRISQLFAGLVLYGISDAMLVLGGLGLDPWDVFHQGLARRTGLPIGTWAILVGVAVLLLWIPLRQRPGFGTVSNAVGIGLVINLVLAVVPVPHSLPVRWATLLGGVLLNGVATGCYIGAGLGPGPRDGLMTGIAGRGHSVRVIRTSIELTVLAAGWLLGGTVGIGTVLYALGIGPLVHVFLPRLTIRSAVTPAAPAAPAESRPVPAITPAVPAAGRVVPEPARQASADRHVMARSSRAPRFDQEFPELIQPDRGEPDDHAGIGLVVRRDEDC